jgi:uncharacterized surface protein with fasciclin (FAS1) repeats
MISAGVLVSCADGSPPPASTQAMSTSIPTDSSALFGGGCDTLPSEPANPASPAAMRGRTVHDIVEHHPQLSTLRNAVRTAGMLHAFDDRTGLTVLMPTNAAFDKVPGWQMKLALASHPLLTRILKYHVIEKPLPPKQLNLDGPFDTMEGSQLRVKGFGERLRLGIQNAHVICGNIAAKNATVYLIDTVLLPA